jgi:hypothetical protein
MRMDRLTLCTEICKKIQISRIDNQKKFLTKRELLCVYSHLSAVEEYKTDEINTNE